MSSGLQPLTPGPLTTARVRQPLQNHTESYRILCCRYEPEAVRLGTGAFPSCAVLLASYSYCTPHAQSGSVSTWKMLCTQLEQEGTTSLCILSLGCWRSGNHTHLQGRVT